MSVNSTFWRNTEISIECPFYIRGDGQERLVCEGPDAEGVMVSHFKTQQSYYAKIFSCCCMKYAECEIAQQAMKKYGPLSEMAGGRGRYEDPEANIEKTVISSFETPDGLHGTISLSSCKKKASCEPDSQALAENESDSVLPESDTN